MLDKPDWLPLAIAKRLLLAPCPIPDVIGDCWEWQGSCKSTGYGQITVKQKGWSVHKYIFLLAGQTVPPRLTLDHLCRNRKCCNPSHLEPVTLKVNVLRGISPLAMKARQTHCKYGHEFTPENTYIEVNDGNHRACMACNRRRQRDTQKRRRLTSLSIR